MIDRFYKDIHVYKYTKGTFETPAEYTLDRTIKGLVQSPSNVKTFNNGKDTTSISGVLFTSIDEKFDEKDLIESNGVRYKIAGAGSQPVGVTGITPVRSQHAEYNLVYVQEGL